MFLLGYSGCAYDSIHLISLRCCDCGNAVMIDTDNFKEVTENYVILKKGVNVVCDKCGNTQPKSERYLPLEPQIVNRPAPRESKLPFWMTREITTEELLRLIPPEN